MSSMCGPTVVLKTELGDIAIELHEKAAPISAGNFLAYVEQGLFKHAAFYRTVGKRHWTPGRELTLIQGGLALSEVQRPPPIPLESGTATGLRHVPGAVSLARAAPDTGGSEFFICIEACPGLDPTDSPVPPADGLGYAVFGQVVAGMDVVRRIHETETTDSAPLELMRGQIIKAPVRILDASVAAENEASS